jgi:hypothetical protein
MAHHYPHECIGGVEPHGDMVLNLWQRDLEYLVQPPKFKQEKMMFIILATFGNFDKNVPNFIMQIRVVRTLVRPPVMPDKPSHPRNKEIFEYI